MTLSKENQVFFCRFKINLDENLVIDEEKKFSRWKR